MTHPVNELEACTTRFSTAGVPSSLASGESNRYQARHTLLPLSFPGALSAPEDYRKDAFSTVPYLFLFHVCHEDANLETILNRQEGAGSRWGEEQEELSPYPTAGAEAQPPHRCFHS